MVSSRSRGASAPTRLFAALALLLLLTGCDWLRLAGQAAADTGQIAIIQDDPAMLSQPGRTLEQFRALGATTVRVVVPWYFIAPKPAARKPPAHFKPSNPNSYPASAWAPYDRIVKDATHDRMTVDFTLSGGAPRWAEGRGIPPQGKDPYYAWKPNPTLYGDFVHAIGERYDGSFKPAGASAPLPAVDFWAIWNEPNSGQDLAPQAIDGSKVPTGAAMYRRLLDAAWSALHATGHGRDTIVIGGLAPTGLSGPVTSKHPQGLPGNYAMTKPLVFIRELYCVDKHFRQLRGRYAKARGCPTLPVGSRLFRVRNPGLFAASGFADHPYPGGRPPVAEGRRLDPNFAEFPQLGNLAKTLDGVNRVYGSRTKFRIYNDEYGYITNPPSGSGFPSPNTAAYYLNWTEYLSWKNPRVASYAQYLLADSPPVAGKIGFNSGLLNATGKPKATYAAYRLPLYLPHTSIGRGRPAEVWGDVRPANYMTLDTGQAQTAVIQLKPQGQSQYQTVDTVRVSDRNGYFDVHVHLPSSGTVRLAYTYPQRDPLLPAGVPGSTAYSRSVKVTVR